MQAETHKNLIFSENLVRAMKKGGFTQESLAGKLGVTHSAVSRWISASCPRSSRMAALADALNVSVRWLEYGEGPMRTVDSETSAGIQKAGEAGEWKRVAEIAIPRMLPAIILEGVKNLISDGDAKELAPEITLAKLAVVLSEAGYA